MWSTFKPAPLHDMLFSLKQRIFHCWAPTASNRLSAERQARLQLGEIGNGESSAENGALLSNIGLAMPDPVRCRRRTICCRSQWKKATQRKQPRQTTERSSQGNLPEGRPILAAAANFISARTEWHRLCLAAKAAFRIAAAKRSSCARQDWRAH
eukprot:365733-Chlamydomonas_euryale.AAC.24